MKSKAFIEQTLEMLRTNYIDLNIGKYKVIPNRLLRHASPLNTIRGVSELSARFEFSMLSGKGGHVLPHTDHPLKIVTMVLTAMPDGEWNSQWGGSTAVVWPKDRRRSYNQANKYMGLDDVDVVKEFPFDPNQALVFIKTFNSWHAVRPMNAPTEDVMRKTITIVIEKRRV